MRKLTNLLGLGLLFFGISSMTPLKTESSTNKQSSLFKKKSESVNSCLFTIRIVNLSSATVSNSFLAGTYAIGSPSGSTDTWTGHLYPIYPGGNPEVVYQSSLNHYLQDISSSTSFITLDSEWYGSLSYVDVTSQTLLKTEYFSGGYSHGVSLPSNLISNGCVTIDLVINTDY